MVATPSPAVPTGAADAREMSQTLRGIPASPGVAAGTVRIARTFDDVLAAQGGSVLVFEELPALWVPALRSPAAVVVAVGGALSNFAIVLRERSIPAVVGVGSTLAELRDGDVVEVDGSTGLIHRR